VEWVAGEEDEGTSTCVFTQKSQFCNIYRRLLELAAAIKSTFEPVIQTGLYPRSQIDIIVEIHQQDGGVLSSCINATTLALTDAGVAMYDQVVAVCAGLHSTSILLDLNHYEENDIPHLTVGIMPRSGKVTLVNMESRLHLTRFEAVFKLACEAATIIQKEMSASILSRTGSLVNTMAQADPRAQARMDDAMDE
jgi:exosome complex component RRP41